MRAPLNPKKRGADPEKLIHIKDGNLAAVRGILSEDDTVSPEVRKKVEKLLRENQIGKPDPDSRLLTVKEVCRELRISRATLYRLSLMKKKVKIRNATRFRREDVEPYKR